MASDPMVRRILGESEYTAEVEDAAYAFIEEDLGRFDWINNWNQQKNPDKRVADWCSKWAVGVDANAVTSLINKWASGKPFSFR